MWSTKEVWFELFIFSTILLFGNILMGHFEERTSRYKRFFKTLILLIVFSIVSIVFGKMVSFTLLGLSFIPVLYIHIVVLKNHGINGWTGEPKEKYYEFRGWDKDIFNSGKKTDSKKLDTK